MSHDRVALISGANRGIGAAVAQRLLANGWRVSLGMRRPARPDWAPDPARAHMFAYDAVAGLEPAWTEEALAAFGRIDAIVANAGIIIPGSLIEAEDEALDAMLEVNVKAPRRLAKAAWPALTATGAGRVAIIASLSGKRVASAATSLYSMSKFAAVALAHGLRHEGWDHGLRATAVCPGFVATDMARSLTATPDADMTQPEDVARLVELALDLPNSASLAEICVNCRDGDQY